MRTTLPILLAVALGCGKPSLNAPSQETMQQSVHEQTRNLSPEKEEEYREALIVIMATDVEWNGEASELTETQKLLQGMTVDEIIAMGNKIKAEHLARMREQLPEK